MVGGWSWTVSLPPLQIGWGLFNRNPSAKYAVSVSRECHGFSNQRSKLKIKGKSKQSAYFTYLFHQKTLCSKTPPFTDGSRGLLNKSAEQVSALAKRELEQCSDDGLARNSEPTEFMG